ncbi:MAG: hypothetical protein D6812_09880 [Deltaproteobacteria bacterium]|nr:MAG: hypothetical protein D6812_09880 [Deltaproteobacteria bacterium]
MDGIVFFPLPLRSLYEALKAFSAGASVPANPVCSEELKKLLEQIEGTEITREEAFSLLRVANILTRAWDARENGGFPAPAEFEFDELGARSGWGRSRILVRLDEDGPSIYIDGPKEAEESVRARALAALRAVYPGLDEEDLAQEYEELVDEY